MLKRIQGPGILRKNNFIINTGDNLTANERQKRINLNKAKYGLSESEVKALKLPKGVPQKKGQTVLTMDQILNPKNNFSTVEKLAHFDTLERAILKKLEYIESKREEAENCRPCGIVVVLKKDEFDEGYEIDEVIKE